MSKVKKLPLRIGNFMDSCLEDLATKGNLHHALYSYNPKMRADKVIHFTPCKHDIKYQNLFNDRNIEIFPYSWDKRIKLPLVCYVIIFFEIFKKIRIEKINLIRGRLPYFGSFIGCVCGKILNIPSVVSLGGDNRIGQIRSGEYVYGCKFVSFTIEHITLRICNKIIVPNQFTKEYVASIIGKHNADAKTIEIPWALMDDQVDMIETNADQLMVDFTIPIILIVGFINTYKYSDVIFEVIREFKDTILKKVLFVFCGDGPLKEVGERIFLKEKNVHFLGWKNNQMVKKLIHLSNIILVPMSGYVLLEAAREGKAVIASNVEWHSEIIIDGETGYLVEPTDVKQWKMKISELLKNPGNAARVGKNLKKVFDCKYAPDEIIDKEISLYETLL